MEHQKTKSPDFSELFIFLCNSLVAILVEVAGIEPASENLSRQASTCVVRVLLNP